MHQRRRRKEGIHEAVEIVEKLRRRKLGHQQNCPGRVGGVSNTNLAEETPDCSRDQGGPKAAPKARMLKSGVPPKPPSTADAYSLPCHWTEGGRRLSSRDGCLRIDRRQTKTTK